MAGLRSAKHLDGIILVLRGVGVEPPATTDARNGATAIAKVGSRHLLMKWHVGRLVRVSTSNPPFAHPHRPAVNTGKNGGKGTAKSERFIENESKRTNR